MTPALVIALRVAAHALPDVLDADVDPFVDAAIAEATPRVSAALIVAIGWGESRLDPHAGPACGAMQVYPRDLGRPTADCAVWATDVRAGVAAGVAELEIELADRRVAGSLRLALLYRACGNVAFSGGCSVGKRQWVEATLRRAASLAR